MLLPAPGASPAIGGTACPTAALRGRLSSPIASRTWISVFRSRRDGGALEPRHWGPHAPTPFSRVRAASHRGKPRHRPIASGGAADPRPGAGHQHDFILQDRHLSRRRGQTGNLAVLSRNGYRKIDADPAARQGRASDQRPDRTDRVGVAAACARGSKGMSRHARGGHPLAWHTLYSGL